MKSIILYLLLTLATSTGCSYYTYFPQSDNALPPATNPDAIKIYAGDVDRGYEIIASVSAWVVGDGEDVAKYLKRKVAMLGADAVIHVKLTKENSRTSRTGISGVAIKLK